MAPRLVGIDLNRFVIRLNQAFLCAKEIARQVPINSIEELLGRCENRWNGRTQGTTATHV